MDMQNTHTTQQRKEIISLHAYAACPSIQYSLNLTNEWMQDHRLECTNWKL